MRKRVAADARRESQLRDRPMLRGAWSTRRLGRLARPVSADSPVLATESSGRPRPRHARTQRRNGSQRQPGQRPPGIVALGTARSRNRLGCRRFRHDDRWSSSRLRESARTGVHTRPVRGMAITKVGAGRQAPHLIRGGRAASRPPAPGREEERPDLSIRWPTCSHTRPRTGRSRTECSTGPPPSDPRAESSRGGCRGSRQGARGDPLRRACRAARAAGRPPRAVSPGRVP
jgi:hypothetical protein